MREIDKGVPCPASIRRTRKPRPATRPRRTGRKRAACSTPPRKSSGSSPPRRTGCRSSTLVGLLSMGWGRARSFGYGLALASVSSSSSPACRPGELGDPAARRALSHLPGRRRSGHRDHRARRRGPGGGEFQPRSAHDQRSRRAPARARRPRAALPSARLIFSGGGAQPADRGPAGIGSRTCIFRTRSGSRGGGSRSRPSPAPRPRMPHSREGWWSRSRASAGFSSPRAGTCPVPWAAFARWVFRSWPTRWISAPAGRRTRPAVSPSSPKV